MVPKITKGQLNKLQKTLRTDTRIGKSLGITRQSVHLLRKKLGVAMVSKEKPNRDSEIAAAYIAGEPVTAIVKRFGLSTSQTYRVINAANGRAKRKAAAKRAGLPPPKTSGRKPNPKKAVAAKKTSKKSSAKKSSAKEAPKRKYTRRAAPIAKKTAKKRGSKKR